MTAAGPGLFVTGTDTGVGKTYLCAAILAAARRAGVPIRPLKPVLTGTEEVGVEQDHQLLGRLAGLPPDAVAPFAFPFPASPHLASALAGRPLEAQKVVGTVRAELEAAWGRGETVIVEGVGGVIVPLADRYTVLDLVAELGLPALVVARSTLGTINHTALTVRALEGAGVEVVGVVLNRFPKDPGPIEADNKKTVEALLSVAVHTFPDVAAEPQPLAEAAAALPWQRWLSGRPDQP